MAALRLGDVQRYFEDAFVFYRAAGHISYCVTNVIDGVITDDKQTGRDLVSKVRLGEADYLVRYVRDNTFHLAEMLNDDYFKAIKLLFNSGLHVSSSKLLMSCIDTLAFVEHGDVPDNFSQWLSVYVDLRVLGVSAEEVWQFRNSLVHMTNLASRQVLAGKVSPIMPVLGPPPPPKHGDVAKRFDLHRMMLEVIAGANRWAATYSDTTKMLKFIERYDSIISDGRMTRLT